MDRSAYIVLTACAVLAVGLCRLHAQEIGEPLVEHFFPDRQAVKGGESHDWICDQGWTLSFTQKGDRVFGGFDATSDQLDPDFFGTFAGRSDGKTFAGRFAHIAIGAKVDGTLIWQVTADGALDSTFRFASGRTVQVRWTRHVIEPPPSAKPPGGPGDAPTPPTPPTPPQPKAPSDGGPVAPPTTRPTTQPQNRPPPVGPSFVDDDE
jgi:hypothetical protein